MDIDPVYVLLLLAGGLGTIDRGIALVSRLGSRWSGLRRWDRDRARAIAERVERDEALAELAARADQILEAVGKNGKPLHDRVSEMQVGLADVNRRLDRGDARMGRIEERIGALEERGAA